RLTASRSAYVPNRRSPSRTWGLLRHAGYPLSGRSDSVGRARSASLPTGSFAPMTEVAAIRDAILNGAPADEIAGFAMPEAVRGALVGADEQEMFDGLESEQKDPRKSTHVEEFPLPELAPDEAYVAVMASAINFNTVWTSIFEPVPTFGFLKRLGRESVW